MADTVTTTIQLKLQAKRSVNMDNGTETVTHTVSEDTSFVDGTSTSQNDEVFCVTRTITAAAYENHDLTSLTQDDGDGNTVRSSITFAGGVKTLGIRNTSSSGYLVIGGGTDNTGDGSSDEWVGAAGEGWLVDDSDLIHLPAGAEMFWTFPAGVSVGAGNKVLGMGAVTADQTYELIITGDKS